MPVNRHGLSRTIPEEIKRRVRAQSKFGCVVCRCAVYQYEHIDPEFIDATEHNPDAMCLLCGGCHDLVTRGRLSKEAVLREYQVVQSSPTVEEPFEKLDLTSRQLTVKLGTAIFHNASSLIRINGEDVLAIEAPLDGSSFPKISGLFTDNHGRRIFEIQDNVWFGSLDLWDIVIAGRTATFRTQAGHIALEFEINPPNELAITKLDMRFGEAHIVCDAEALLVGRVSENGNKYIGIGRIEAINADAAVSVNTSNAKVEFRGVSIIGGEGVELQGAGIRIGYGSPSMTVRDLQVWEV